MTELEELIARKKDIERRIREIRDTTKYFGRTKYEVVNYQRGSEHTISIKKRGEDPHYERYYAVIGLTDKNEAINELGMLIEDLKGLSAELIGEVLAGLSEEKGENEHE